MDVLAFFKTTFLSILSLLVDKNNTRPKPVVTREETCCNLSGQNHCKQKQVNSGDSLVVRTWALKAMILDSFPGNYQSVTCQ